MDNIVHYTNKVKNGGLAEERKHQLEQIQRRYGMAKIGTGLDAKDPSPVLRLQPTSGEPIQIPEYTGNDYGVLLVYRGYW